MDIKKESYLWWSRILSKIIYSSRTTYNIEKRKIPTSTNQRTTQRNKDDNIQKYNELNQEINKIVRTINMQFNFKNFTKEKLQPLEQVSKR